MEQPVEPLGGVPVRKAALQPVVPRLLLQLSPVLSLPAQREVLVPGDLAQPYPQLAVPRNWSMEANARKKVSWVTSSAVWASRLRARM